MVRNQFCWQICIKEVQVSVTIISLLGCLALLFFSNIFEMASSRTHKWEKLDGRGQTWTSSEMITASNRCIATNWYRMAIVTEGFEIQLGSISSIWVCLTIKNMPNNMILESPKSLGFSLKWTPYTTSFCELHHDVATPPGILETRFPGKCARQQKFLPKGTFLELYSVKEIIVMGAPLLFICWYIWTGWNVKAKGKFVEDSCTLFALK